MEALIKSGLAMLIFGQSHPASGGEHHLSHYWEMEFLKQERPQILHGLKVGVSTSLLVDIYKKELLPLLNESGELSNENENEAILQNSRNNRQGILSWVQSLPESLTLLEALSKVGGATEPKQLGIENGLVNRSLEEAHHLRDRFTILKLLNEIIKVHHIYTR
jgi:glycerol-1-phosphate dehydrogenase [NAD(P)+]